MEFINSNDNENNSAPLFNKGSSVKNNFINYKNKADISNFNTMFFGRIYIFNISNIDALSI